MIEDASKVRFLFDCGSFASDGVIVTIASHVECGAVDVGFGAKSIDVDPGSIGRAPERLDLQLGLVVKRDPCGSGCIVPFGCAHMHLVREKRKEREENEEQKEKEKKMIDPVKRQKKRRFQ